MQLGESICPAHLVCSGILIEALDDNLDFVYRSTEPLLVLLYDLGKLSAENCTKNRHCQRNSP
jgi:hypothetical protein